MGSGGVDETDREGIPDGTDFFHAEDKRSRRTVETIYRGPRSRTREKIAEFLEFDPRRDL